MLQNHKNCLVFALSCIAEAKVTPWTWEGEEDQPEQKMVVWISECILQEAEAFLCFQSSIIHLLFT